MDLGGVTLVVFGVAFRIAVWPLGRRARALAALFGPTSVRRSTRLSCHIDNRFREVAMLS